MSVTTRRAALIEAAFRVIADHGVEGATTRRICAHADMPLASFHYAFESRTQLLSAVMAKAVPDDLGKILRTVMPGDLSEVDDLDRALESINAQLQSFYRLLRADPGRLQAAISLGIYAHNHPELRAAGAQMYQALYGVAEEGLVRAGAAAGIRWTQPTAQIAPVIIASTNAVTLIYLSTSDEAVVQTVLSAVARQILTYVETD